MRLAKKRPQHSQTGSGGGSAPILRKIDFPEKRPVHAGRFSVEEKEGAMDYSGAKWKRKRERILKMDGYLCQVSRRYGKVVQARVVHHIYPAKEYPEYAWCDWNLISVSMGVHNRLEDRATGELTNEGKELMRHTKPGDNWRKRRDGNGPLYGRNRRQQD